MNTPNILSFQHDMTKARKLNHIDKTTYIHTLCSELIEITRQTKCTDQQEIITLLNIIKQHLLEHTKE